MKKILFLLTVLLSACNSPESSGLTIIDRNTGSIDLSGSSVVLGEEGLIAAHSILLTDSLCVLIDGSNSGDFFRCYDLVSFKEQFSFGEFGDGPADFMLPLPVKSADQKKNCISVLDVNNGRLSDIYVDKDSLSVSGTTMDELLFCFNINRLNDTLYAGTKMGEQSEGLFFTYNATDKEFGWVDYSTGYEKELSEARSSLYYSALCANAEKGIFIVALRYFNRLLFFDADGSLLKEVQIGKKLLSPVWDKEFQMVALSPYYFEDVCITDDFIYALWSNNSLEDEALQLANSQVFVFDWNLNHVNTYNLDAPVLRMAVVPDNRFMVGLVDDGTGLTDVVKYTF